MTLKVKNNLHENNTSSSKNNCNVDVVNAANISSTLEQITTLINFEQLREACLIQGMKENLNAILVCIRGIKSDLAKLHIESNDINRAEHMAEALEYEDFYNGILEDLENPKK